jgi:hypothetical protein
MRMAKCILQGVCIRDKTEKEFRKKNKYRVLMLQKIIRRLNLRNYANQKMPIKIIIRSQCTEVLLSLKAG